MRRIPIRSIVVVAFAIGGAIAVSQAPAQAYPNCERYAHTPTFSGDRMQGVYEVVCGRTVPQATLHGALKEDRNTLPDIVHVTGSSTFTFSESHTVGETNCQDGDDIYTESRINSESPAQSTRAEMNC